MPRSRFISSPIRDRPATPLSKSSARCTPARKAANPVVALAARKVTATSGAPMPVCCLQIRRFSGKPTPPARQILISAQTTTAIPSKKWPTGKTFKFVPKTASFRQTSSACTKSTKVAAEACTWPRVRARAASPVSATALRRSTSNPNT
uniref:(northern house mosquito) hypothetical protein n=1 Tax=Culex pipiens TaxID=7175 RepID=A0A8D8NX65_CULPI